MDSIPVIDLDFFTSCEITDSVLSDVRTKEIAEQIRHALHDVGFMYLINHRVSPVVVSFFETCKVQPLLIFIVNCERSKMHSTPASRSLI